MFGYAHVHTVADVLVTTAPPGKPTVRSNTTFADVNINAVASAPPEYEYRNVFVPTAFAGLSATVIETPNPVATAGAGERCADNPSVVCGRSAISNDTVGAPTVPAVSTRSVVVAAGVNVVSVATETTVNIILFTSVVVTRGATTIAPAGFTAVAVTSTGASVFTPE